MDQNQQQQGCFVGFSSFLFVSRGIDSLLLSLYLYLTFGRLELFAQRTELRENGG